MKSGLDTSSSTDHFYDTNFFLHHEDKLPANNSNAAVTNWITETTRSELIEKLGDSAVKLKTDEKFKTLRFDDLYQENPGICPTYFYFVSCMYMPANPASNDFFEDRLNAKLARGGDLTTEERKFSEKYRRLIAREYEQSLIAIGNPEGLREMLGMGRTTLKKARASAKDLHPAYLNDIRALSLVIYNALSSKKDAVFHTADGDPSHLLLKWLSSVCFRVTFHMQLLKLQTVDSQIERKILSGEVIRSSIRFKDFVKTKSEIFKMWLNQGRQDSGVRISIRRWDQKKCGFDDSMYLEFPKELADMLVAHHGQLNCPFTPNAMVYNWVTVNYEWPPQDPQSDEIKFSFAFKNLKRTAPRVSSDFHRKICRYCKEDSSGELATWSD